MSIAKYLEYFPECFSTLPDGYLLVDFLKLETLDVDIADKFLESPISVINEFKEKIGTSMFFTPNTSILFKNLPLSIIKPISKLKAEDTGKFLSIKGTIIQTSEVYSVKISSDFECCDCGNILTIEHDREFHKPNICFCGCTKFKEKDFKTKNELFFRVEENQQDLDYQPFSIKCILPAHLCKDNMLSKVYQIGTNVRVDGFLREYPINKKENKLLKEIDVINISFENDTDVSLNQEDIEKIKEMSKNSQLMDLFVKSFAPHIVCDSKIKEPIILQLFGGTTIDEHGVYKRGDSHIILIGDPSTSKTQLVRFAAKLAPKARHISGTHATGIGLTATAVKDEETKRWVAKAGALVLADNGICTIDEFNNIAGDEKALLKDALESQEINLAKAGINAKFKCRTSLLCACNPKFSRFDPMKNIDEQFNIEEALLSRFDVKIIFRDIPNEVKDGEIADAILKLHTEGTLAIDFNMFRKYITYARNTCKRITLSSEAKDCLKRWYVSLRASSTSERVSATPRWLESVARLAQARAKMFLRDVVTEDDAIYAYELCLYWIKKIGLTEEGVLDAYQATTGTKAASVKLSERIYDAYKLLKDDNNICKIWDICSQLSDVEPEKVEKLINELINKGEYLTPKHGTIKAI